MQFPISLWNAYNVAEVVDRVKCSSADNETRTCYLINFDRVMFTIEDSLRIM